MCSGLQVRRVDGSAQVGMVFRCADGCNNESTAWEWFFACADDRDDGTLLPACWEWSPGYSDGRDGVETFMIMLGWLSRRVDDRDGSSEVQTVRQLFCSAGQVCKIGCVDVGMACGWS